ncbi:MAG: PSP1 domain-containing protein, partial [Phycisphaerales bacterium]
EMLTSTCPNAGCSKSVTRKEMLEYIDRSGGKDYPFYSKGRVLRVATVEDLQIFDRLREQAGGWRKRVQELAEHYRLDMKIVEVEPILGNELLTVYYLSEDRIDFRDLVKDLGTEFGTRVEMRQIGARDEARLVADYEKCGQHCCCKQFLKVLKPISMRSAKIQKATLDPLKISGRCGRLMCCLRYEDETYDDLRKNLPRRKAHVGTPHGPGIVRDSQILTQLVLVSLDHNHEQVAVPVEELISVEESRELLAKGVAAQPDPLRGMDRGAVATRTSPASDKPTPEAQQTSYRERSQRESDPEAGSDDKPARQGRRRRRSGASRPDQTGKDSSAGSRPAKSGESSETPAKPKRRRKARTRKDGEKWSPPDLRDRTKGDGSSGGDTPTTDSGSGSPSGESENRGRSPEDGSSKPRPRRRRKPRGGRGNKGNPGGGAEGGSGSPGESGG